MNVLVINCGSSSIKYAVYEMPQAKLLGGGIVDRIGQGPSTLQCEHGGRRQTQRIEANDHSQAVRLILDGIAGDQHKLVPAGGKIDVVGHRVVHGGSIKSEIVFIDDGILGAVAEFAPMAPLHNPPTLAAIRTAMDVMPDIPHVACFDTAFHHTIPDVAYIYGLPARFYGKYGVRRYGFHGISHRFVYARAAHMLGCSPEGFTAVTCHLGNGCSVAAIRDGRSVDTSMGMTPLEGLLMGTRAGDIDPGISLYLLGKGLGADELTSIMNNESGLLGISQVSADMRDVLRAAGQGHKRAELAIQVFCYRLRKYIGAYIAVLGDLHALVFTGGIGENAAEIRRRTCADMGYLGIEIDPETNERTVGWEGDIATGESRARVLVIPTNEELAIADNACRLLAGRSCAAAR